MKKMFKHDFQNILKYYEIYLDFIEVVKFYEIKWKELRSNIYILIYTFYYLEYKSDLFLFSKRIYFYI